MADLPGYRKFKQVEFERADLEPTVMQGRQQ